MITTHPLFRAWASLVTKPLNKVGLTPLSTLFISPKEAFTKLSSKMETKWNWLNRKRAQIYTAFGNSLLKESLGSRRHQMEAHTHSAGAYLKYGHLVGIPASVNLCFEFVKKWTTLILQDMFRSIIDHLRYKCVFENYHETGSFPFFPGGISNVTSPVELGPQASCCHSISS